MPHTPQGSVKLDKSSLGRITKDEADGIYKFSCTTVVKETNKYQQTNHTTQVNSLSFSYTRKHTYTQTHTNTHTHTHTQVYMLSLEKLW